MVKSVNVSDGRTDTKGENNNYTGQHGHNALRETNHGNANHTRTSS